MGVLLAVAAGWQWPAVQDGRLLTTALLVWLLAQCALLVAAAEAPARYDATMRHHPALAQPWRLPFILMVALPGAWVTLISLGIASDDWLGRGVTFGLALWWAVLVTKTVRWWRRTRQQRASRGVAAVVGGFALRLLVGAGVARLAWPLLPFAGERRAGAGLLVAVLAGSLVPWALGQARARWTGGPAAPVTPCLDRGVLLMAASLRGDAAVEMPTHVPTRAGGAGRRLNRPAAAPSRPAARGRRRR